MKTNLKGDGKKDSNNSDQKNANWMILAGSLFGVFCLWFLTLCLTPFFLDSWQARPQFGEMFIAVNALFSGLAFAAIVFTLYLQRGVLELQRQNLQHAQEQSKKQAQQLDAQRQLVSKQNFENTFFRMLDILDRQATEVTMDEFIEQDGREFRGHEAFRHFYFGFGIQNQRIPHEALPVEIPGYELIFRAILDSNPQFLNYFGTFVHALSFLDESEMKVKEKSFYGTFLSAQLSPSERLLLFYYGLLPEFEKTKTRMERYFVLTGINLKDLLEPSHRGLYQESAWTPFNRPPENEG
jgi:hypothetical protein